MVARCFQIHALQRTPDTWCFNAVPQQLVLLRASQRRMLCHGHQKLASVEATHVREWRACAPLLAYSVGGQAYPTVPKMQETSLNRGY